MHILLCNDDGFRAAGIQELAQAMLAFGQVTILAPDGPRSGFSGAITTTQPLRLKHRSTDGDLSVYSCDGTPVDCIKLAMNTLFAEERPDLSISYTVRIVQMMQQLTLPRQTYLSLNVPKTSPKGLKVCPMSVGRFVEELVPSSDGRGKPIYWLTGHQEPMEEGRKADWHYLQEGWATLTPLQLDSTDYQWLETLERAAQS